VRWLGWLIGMVGRHDGEGMEGVGSFSGGVAAGSLFCSYPLLFTQILLALFNITSLFIISRVKRSRILCIVRMQKRKTRAQLSRAFISVSAQIKFVLSPVTFLRLF
jgi:hypothetical protein